MTITCNDQIASCEELKEIPEKKVKIAFSKLLPKVESFSPMNGY